MVGNTGTVEITERFLESYDLGHEARARLFDSKLVGFGVVVGRKRTTFVVQRRIDGEQKTVTLGHWGPPKARAMAPDLLTVARARDQAIQALADMRRGVDPRGGDESSRAGGPTLRDGLELHCKNMRKAGRSPRSIETIETEIPRLMGPWLDRPMAELRGEDLVKVHDRLTDEDKSYLANRIVAHVSAVWNSLDKVHELSGRNPARAVTRNRYVPKRERIDDADLPAWWAKVQELSEVRRDLRIFCLFTGMRSEAARHVRWEHLDEEKGSLLIPKPKGGEAKAFTLPLPRTIIAMLAKRRQSNARELQPFGGDGGWCFPSLSRAAPFVVQPIAEAKEYRRDPISGGKVKQLPGLHVCRRTYLSVATEAGIGELDRHVLANHAYGRQSVNATYIEQAWEHLAKCQTKIEAALLERLGVSPRGRSARK